jgi:XRE family transcriptional regulator, regulator of sulfur utilization
MTAPANLARNIRALREARSLTQKQLSDRSGVPRPTWANLESGSSNPTLSVLVKVASALAVSIEELIGPPRATGRFYAADQLPGRTRGGVRVGKVLPDALTGIDIERIALPSGKAMGGVPHTAGTREYLFCERGKIELTASGTGWTLSPGDCVVFRGDQRHSYRNRARGETVAYSVVLLPPPGD